MKNFNELHPTEFNGGIPYKAIISNVRSRYLEKKKEFTREEEEKKQ